MMKMMVLIILISSMLILIISFVSKINTNTFQKFFEFECGFNSISLNRLSFSIHYFLITILFLIFDLEIILIIPILMEEKKIFESMNMMMNLILILSIGLLIEWMFKMVEWSK